MLHSDIPVWENMQVAAGVSNRDGLVMYFDNSLHHTSVQLWDPTCARSFMGCYYDYLIDNLFIEPRLMYSEVNGNKYSLPSKKSLNLLRETPSRPLSNQRHDSCAQ